MRDVTLTLCSRGNMGSGIICFLEDLQCNTNQWFIPEKGYVCRFDAFLQDFGFLKINMF